MSTILLLIATSLFFSGCGQCEPEVKTVFIKSKVPKLKTLYPVKPYAIKNVTEFNSNNYIVPKKELENASSVSKKRIRIINFYEKQNMKFNKEFAAK